MNREIDENFYRKWVGITIACKLRPLIMRLDDEGLVRISHKGEEVMRLSKELYDKCTANDLVHKIHSKCTKVCNVCESELNYACHLYKHSFRLELRSNK